MPLSDTQASFPLKTLFSLLDLTDLGESCTKDSIKDLCQQSRQHGAYAAAVCVWPAFVTFAASLLETSPVAIAAVINFPAGTQPLSGVLEDIQHALNDGADEIDLVFPRERFFAGEIAEVQKFLKACRNATQGKILKIILESGAFPDQASLSDACRLACEEEADFLKTSTGKISVGATLPAVHTLLKVIQDTGTQTGIKISGGIRTVNDALPYLSLARDFMGEAWMTPHHVRFGTSQLFKDPAFRQQSTQ